jgi:quinoprotein glucose dehydrogenase
LTAVNANTGDIAWRVPLGNYDEVEAQGLRNAGTPNMGGSMVTAGGLVFIAATTDARFRAFDSRTGKELWMARLDATGDAVPMTYQGRNGKQYVVIAAGGTNRFRMLANTAGQTADSLIAFSLPDAGDSRSPVETGAAVTQSKRRTPRVRFSEEDLRAAGPPLPEGAGKELVVRMCTKCHGTAVFSRIRMTREGWGDEVTDMIEKGATGTPDEIRRVVDYLASHYGENEAPQR